MQKIIRLPCQKSRYSRKQWINSFYLPGLENSNRTKTTQQIESNQYPPTNKSLGSHGFPGECLPNVHGRINASPSQTIPRTK